MEFKNICEVPYEVGFWPRQMDWDDKGNLTNINMNEVLMTWENLAFDYNCDMDQVIPGYEFEFGHNITTVGDWFRDVIKPFPKVTALRRIYFGATDIGYNFLPSLTILCLIQILLPYEPLK